VGLAVASTVTCRQFGLSADFPISFVLTAIIFPVVFSINAAYQRRETALGHFANMEAHAQAIYFAVRDWMPAQNEASLQRARDLLKQIFVAMSETLMEEPSRLPDLEKRVYEGFSALSAFIRSELRGGEMATGELSRTNQYLSKMMVSFESIKRIYEYRTPISLRTFGDFFLVLLPVLYGPYFAFLGQDYHLLLALIPPVVLALVLVSLDNIQEHLENPFDQLGEDDIKFNVDSFLERLK
jgi:predicted membrane chloride channel (bestrophin family)